MALSNPANSIVWTLGLFGILSYVVIVIIHRLFFHPLAKFPGPKIAAMTDYWELYQDYFRAEGQFLYNELDRLHEQYGPIVRIRPNEVHVKDSHWMSILYPGSSERRDRDPLVGNALGTPSATAATSPFELHRMRKAAIHPYFTGKSLTNWDPTLHHFASLLRQDMEGRIGEVLDLRAYFFAWTTDALTSHIFQKRLGMFWDRERAEEWYTIMFNFSSKFPLTKHFPWMVTLALELPLIAWKILYPSLVPYIAVFKSLIDMSKAAYDVHQSTEGLASKDKDPADKSILETILTSDLPLSEKQPKRLASELFHVLVAGSFSTAKTATVAVYYILANPEVYRKLQMELKDVISDSSVMPSIQSLKQCEYLTAVIKEVMRLSCIVTTRFPMIAPDHALKYEKYVIPPGVSVSMTYCKAAMDSTIFSQPHLFRPERWLSHEQSSNDYQKFVLPFGRGSRACIGQDIAYMQLYLVLAVIFRSFDIALFETTYEDDIKIRGGGPLGEPWRKTKGTRIMVNGTIKSGQQS